MTEFSGFINPQEDSVDMIAPCWYCAAENNMGTQVSGVEKRHQINNGDVSLCIYCGELAVYHDGVFKEPTVDERIEFNRVPANQKIQRALMKAINDDGGLRPRADKGG